MQKLSGRNTYTPRDVQSLPVPRSVVQPLNKEETLSVVDSKTRPNNPEGVQVQHAGRPLKALVHVLSKEGKPSLPRSGEEWNTPEWNTPEWVQAPQFSSIN